METAGERLDGRPPVQPLAVGPRHVQPAGGDAGADRKRITTLLPRAPVVSAPFRGRRERSILRQSLIELTEVVEAQQRPAGGPAFGLGPAEIAEQTVSEPAARDRTQLLFDRLEASPGALLRTRVQPYRINTGEPPDSPRKVHSREETFLPTVTFEV